MSRTNVKIPEDKVMKSTVLKVSEIVGHKFGRLVVISHAYNMHSHIYVNCICDCGKRHISRYDRLKAGKGTSCGCAVLELKAKRMTKHGMFKTRIYGIWRGMMQRCENKRYVNYHGRGIKVCERWHNFDNFYNDTKEGYSDSLSLDRYPDKNGNYEPLNFRWATSKQQGRNTRSNVILEYAGERLIIAEWAEKLKISHKIISSRISLGWEIERVLTEPVYFSKGKNQFGNNKKITQCQQVCP